MKVPLLDDVADFGKFVFRNTLRSYRWYRANLHSSARGVTHRYRNGGWPVVIGLVLLEAAVVATQYPTSTVFAISLLTSAGVVFYLRRKLNRRPEWTYALSCLGATVLAMTLFSVMGFDSRPLNVFCVLAWGTATVIWWQHHSSHPRPSLPNVGQEILSLWSENVAPEPTKKVPAKK